jgi:hypothetical protein
MKMIIKFLVLIIVFNSCIDKKIDSTTHTEIEISKNVVSEKIFSNSEIAKYTISSIMNQPSEIIKVKENNEVFYVSYIRKDDNKKFDYKIKIDKKRVIWGNNDGRWRESKFDEKIIYSEKDSVLKITQIFDDGSKIIKEYRK